MNERQKLLRELAIPFLITPSTAVAYDGIEKENVGDASGLFNMSRNLGGSVGIGIAGTLLSRRYSVHFDHISESFNYTDQASMIRLNEMTHAFLSQGQDMMSATAKAIGSMNGLMNRESFILSFGDCFFVMGVISLLCILCVVFMNKVKGEGASGH